MSLYAEYLKERTDDEIIEWEEGFVTYRYLENQRVYIIDIYVRPEFRRRSVATEMADRVCKEAQERGCKEVIGTVAPACKGSHESMLALIGYNMKIESCSSNLIVFKKDL